MDDATGCRRGVSTRGHRAIVARYSRRRREVEVADSPDGEQGRDILGHYQADLIVWVKVVGSVAPVRRLYEDDQGGTISRIDFYRDMTGEIVVRRYMPVAHVPEFELTSRTDPESVEPGIASGIHPRNSTLAAETPGFFDHFRPRRTADTLTRAVRGNGPRVGGPVAQYLAGSHNWPTIGDARAVDVRGWRRWARRGYRGCLWIPRTRQPIRLCTRRRIARIARGGVRSECR